MKIGYEISIKPASVAFFDVIEKPMKSSAMRSTTVPPSTYQNNSRDEPMATRSGLRFPDTYETTNVTIETHKNAILIEERTEIFL